VDGLFTVRGTGLKAGDLITARVLDSDGVDLVGEMVAGP
jgi:hypothetical protein